MKLRAKNKNKAQEKDLVLTCPLQQKKGGKEKNLDD